jgi:hypothetical protein
VTCSAYGAPCLAAAASRLYRHDYHLGYHLCSHLERSLHDYHHDYHRGHHGKIPHGHHDLLDHQMHQLHDLPVKNVMINSSSWLIHKYIKRDLLLRTDGLHHWSDWY